MKLSDLVDEFLETATKVQRTQWIALLNPRLAGMVANKQGRLVAAPPSPPLKAREHSRSGPNKRVTIEKVKSILEVDFEEGKAGFPVFLKHIMEGMSHCLHSSWTTNSKVLQFECSRDFTFAS